MNSDLLEKTVPPSKSGPTCFRVAIVGNPNSGKTSLFNALTGLKHKIGNFPGVTVERISGMIASPDKVAYELIDLPGLYSLMPRSLDERIAVEVLTGSADLEPRPDLIIVVADATNLQRSLYLFTQVADLGYPIILALNMMDLVEKQGYRINIDGLARRLDVPIVPVIAKNKKGIQELKQAVFSMDHTLQEARGTSFDDSESLELSQICLPLMHWLKQHGIKSEAGAFAEALRIVSEPEIAEKWKQRGDGDALQHLVEQVRTKFSERGIPYRQAEVRYRYSAIDQICAQNVLQERKGQRTDVSEKIDSVLTHRVFGPLIMVLILATIFQSIYVWASVPMDAIEGLIAWLGDQATAFMPPGALRELIVDGVIAGVGAVLIFLPQIVFLFFFLAILEDTGYLARVAFIMDRFLAKVGLSGRSVVPLLSSFACAIPGIMAARTIQNNKDRLITILVAPFMSCSARLPVYTLMIGAFFPDIWFGGIFYLPGLILLSMYLLGVIVAVISATILQKWVVQGRSTNFIMELPIYRAPVWHFVFVRVYDAARLFVANAGKIILAISIILWFLASYPKKQTDTVATTPGGAEQVENSASKAVGKVDSQIRQSYAGQLGRVIEPVIEPLGFDWKIGIGLITSFAAREVIISTMATIYNVEDADETSIDLRTAIKKDVYADTGKPVFTPLVALSLMVFFVLACQCMSTLAIVRKETGSWKWPIAMFVYMFILAYVASFAVFQVGSLLGFA
ncbi:MAG: ferrous iron transport protein B [Deferribacteres bacterium]|nr:ferrous iron transport protein B [Deferribacteres bacterium]